VSEYHKIQTVYLRDPETKFRTLLLGQYADPAFEFLASNPWVFTEKVDGTNIRVMWDGATVTFGGKTDSAQIPATLVRRLAERFQTTAARQRLAETFAFENPQVVLYGEGYGAKIQKGGGNYRADQDFVLFDVRVGEWWLQRSDVEDIAAKLELDAVPIIGKGTLLEMVSKAQAGFLSLWGNFPAEGIVARPKCELRTRNGHRIITKIKTKDFGGGG
jgi:hypothetical protein